MRKSFEKQTKTIKQQGEEQVKAIKGHRKELVKSDKDVDYERIREKRDLSRQIDFKNLTYYFKIEDSIPINFLSFKTRLYLYRNIFDGNIELAKSDKDKVQFKSDLNEIRRGNPRNKSKGQLIIMKNTKDLYNSPEKVIKLYNHNAKAIYEAEHKAKYGEGLNILSVALGQVKASNNS